MELPGTQHCVFWSQARGRRWAAVSGAGFGVGEAARVLETVGGFSGFLSLYFITGNTAVGIEV